MKNKYKMVTVSDYLKVLDGEKKLNTQDTQTMISVEKFLSEVVKDTEVAKLNANWG